MFAHSLFQMVAEIVARASRRRRESDSPHEANELSTGGHESSSIGASLLDRSVPSVARPIAAAALDAADADTCPLAPPSQSEASGDTASTNEKLSTFDYTEFSQVEPGDTSTSAARATQTVEPLLALTPICLEVGTDLIHLVNPQDPRSRVLDAVAELRRKLALELGWILPGIHVRDDESLPANVFIIRVNELPVRRVKCGKVEGADVHMINCLEQAVLENVPRLLSRQVAHDLLHRHQDGPLPVPLGTYKAILHQLLANRVSIGDQLLIADILREARPGASVEELAAVIAPHLGHADEDDVPDPRMAAAFIYSKLEPEAQQALRCRLSLVELLDLGAGRQRLARAKDGAIDRLLELEMVQAAIRPSATDVAETISNLLAQMSETPTPTGRVALLTALLPPALAVDVARRVLPTMLMKSSDPGNRALSFLGDLSRRGVTFESDCPPEVQERFVCDYLSFVNDRLNAETPLSTPFLTAEAARRCSRDLVGVADRLAEIRKADEQVLETWRKGEFDPQQLSRSLLSYWAHGSHRTRSLQPAERISLFLHALPEDCAREVEKRLPIAVEPPPPSLVSAARTQRVLRQTLRCLGPQTAAVAESRAHVVAS